MQLDPQQLGELVADIVLKAIQPLQAEIKQLQAQWPHGGIGAAVKVYVDNELPNKVEQSQAILLAKMQEAIDAIQKPKDGKDGEKGADGLNGKDGANGEHGRDGKDGANGKDAIVDYDAIHDAINKRVAVVVKAAVDELPKPRDGRDGLPGVPGQPGERGDKGMDGLNGKDGANGIDGKDGTNGRDGVGLENVQFDEDDNGLTIRFIGADFTKEHRLDWNLPIYQGVWREGSYRKNSLVTWGGSMWIAMRETTDKPETSDAWKLAVKRGQMGERGLKGDRGDMGPKGERGLRG